MDLAGFCVIIFVFSLFFACRCLIGGVVSETEIQQQDQRRKDDSQNNLSKIIFITFVRDYLNFFVKPLVQQVLQLITSLLLLLCHVCIRKYFCELTLRPGFFPILKQPIHISVSNIWLQV